MAEIGFFDRISVQKIGRMDEENEWGGAAREDARVIPERMPAQRSLL